MGDPDSLGVNPVDSRFAPVKLYSRYRVEQFLQDNADAYGQHLAKRERYLAVFEQVKNKLSSPESRAKAAQTRKLHQRIEPITEQFDWNKKNEQVREQSLKCLRCASGIASDLGFICAVHPLGLELNQLPCPDWQSR